jgi:hypothetical protein
VLSLLLFATSSFATTYTPNPANLYDLDHDYAYSWGIQVSKTDVITEAVLKITDIHNWKQEDNILYITLFDCLISKGSTGVKTYRDTRTGNYFDQYTYKLLLDTFTDNDTGNTEKDYIYRFSRDELTTLNSYINNDGKFWLGFDPDCHYFNKGITLTLTTAPVPEPASMFLFGAGLMGLAGVSRMRKK